VEGSCWRNGKMASWSWPPTWSWKKPPDIGMPMGHVEWIPLVHRLGSPWTRSFVGPEDWRSSD
jgi:hypothetical protein